MSALRIRMLLALALSLGGHASLVLWAARTPPRLPTPEAVPIELTLAPSQAVKPAAPLPPKVENRKHARVPEAPLPPAPEETPASMAAPPPPMAEEWALAATYKLKNSKRYRYSWGQQVRSMMGTAVAGERQGLVRVHVEIAPDGTLARADVLWSTSDVAEKLALQAIRAMPPLPPTPTGKPLVFDKTIAFLPFETGWPPVYKYDCLPDPPAFHNQFAWNGSAPRPVQRAGTETMPSRSTTAKTECPDTGPDSIEAEEKDMERQFKEWSAGRLNGAE